MPPFRILIECGAFALHEASVLTLVVVSALARTLDSAVAQCPEL